MNEDSTNSDTTSLPSGPNYYDNYDGDKWIQRVIEERKEGKPSGQLDQLCQHGKIGCPPNLRYPNQNVYCDEPECMNEWVPPMWFLAMKHEVPFAGKSPTGPEGRVD